MNHLDSPGAKLALALAIAILALFTGNVSGKHSERMKADAELRIERAQCESLTVSLYDRISAAEYRYLAFEDSLTAVNAALRHEIARLESRVRPAPASRSRGILAHPRPYHACQHGHQNPPEDKKPGFVRRWGLPIAGLLVGGAVGAAIGGRGGDVVTTVIATATSSTNTPSDPRKSKPYKHKPKHKKPCKH